MAALTIDDALAGTPAFDFKDEILAALKAATITDPHAGPMCARPSKEA
jgi:hypothetical protein